MSSPISIFLCENWLPLGAVKMAQSLRCFLYKNEDLSLKSRAYVKKLEAGTLASNPKIKVIRNRQIPGAQWQAV